MQQPIIGRTFASMYTAVPGYNIRHVASISSVSALSKVAAKWPPCSSAVRHIRGYMGGRVRHRLSLSSMVAAVLVLCPAAGAVAAAARAQPPLDSEHQDESREWAIFSLHTRTHGVCSCAESPAGVRQRTGRRGAPRRRPATRRPPAVHFGTIFGTILLQCHMCTTTDGPSDFTRRERERVIADVTVISS